jgi:hypothetical protein
MSLASTPPPKRDNNPAPGTVPSWLADDASPSYQQGGSFATVEPPRSAQTPGSPPSWRPSEGYARSTYRPTAEQLARDEARQAYWRRNVRRPIIIAVVIVVLLFVGLFVLVFGARYLGVSPEAIRSFIAGLSGLTIILMAIPLTALMAILPLVYVAWWWNRREQRRLYPETGPMAYRSRVQTLLWQVDSVLDTARRGTTRGAFRLTRPLIGLYGRADYWRAFARALRRNFSSDR